MSRASAAWDECPAGHAYTEANTGYDRRGHRWCKACAAARNRRWHYARRGLPVPERREHWAHSDEGRVCSEGPPPDEWLDWVVVHRLVTGRERPGRAPTWAEKRDAAARLYRAGCTLTEITARLHTSGEKTHALLAEAGMPVGRGEGVDAA